MHVRWVEERLLRSARDNAVTVLAGPRGSGKTTLVSAAFRGAPWRVLRLDRLDDLEAARTLPVELLGADTHLVIDEAQAAPELLTPLRFVAERERKSVRFVLVASTSPAAVGSLQELVARGAEQVMLGPLAAGELRGIPAGGLVGELLQPGGERKLKGLKGLEDAVRWLGPLAGRVCRGGFPAAQRGSQEEAGRFFQEYEREFLERDVRAVGGVGDLVPLRRALRGAALQSGALVNLAAVAPEAGVSPPTVRRYLEMADRGLLGKLLQPVDLVRKRRLIKAPKFYLRDSGMACHLLGLAPRPDLVFNPLFQALLETWVLQQLEGHAAALGPEADIRYWRTADNREVDFVLRWGRRWLAVDVKHADALKPQMAASLNAFREEYPELVTAGLLVYAGREVVQMGEGVWAVPAAALVM